MRVVCFYTNLHPATAGVVGAVQGDLVEVFGSSGYWLAMRDVWSAGETFVCLEHDIEPTEDQLRTLWDCPESWCAYQYPIGGQLVAALGCTKFSAALIDAHPDLLDRAGEIEDHVPAKDWRRLDERMLAVLRSQGLRGPHIHEPPVIHHHVYVY